MAFVRHYNKIYTQISNRNTVRFPPRLQEGVSPVASDELNRIGAHWQQSGGFKLDLACIRLG